MICWLAVPLAVFAAGGTGGGGGGHAAPPSAPRTHTVEIRGMVFRPESLTVTVDDTVVWINRDIVPHTATAEGKPPRWDTGPLRQGATARYVARHVETLTYICALHPVMRAALTVKEPS